MREVEIKKIDVRDLKIGMYVVELDRPWLGSPFLFQGFPINTEAELQKVQSCCDYVFIDMTQTLFWTPEPSRKTQQEHELTLLEAESRRKESHASHRFSTRCLNIEPVVREYPPQDVKRTISAIEVARQVHRKAQDYIGHVLKDARLGRSIDILGSHELVSDMVDSIVADENALLWLTQLKNRDEYTSMHSINVCVISVLFGRHLGFSLEQLRELGHGALLHDVGKMRVPLELLNKTGDLGEVELDELKKHPEYGYEMLRGSTAISLQALDIVYSHHERVDGSGYPRGLRGDEIGEFALVVSIVDVYDAITSDRVYHMGISPHEALGLMYEWAPKNFPLELLEAFIRCLGIYPIGSIVELNSGEIGVVMTINRTRNLRPIVTLILDADKKAYPVHKLLNLELYEQGEDALNIKQILGSNAYGIDVRSIAMERTAEAVEASA